MQICDKKGMEWNIIFTLDQHVVIEGYYDFHSIFVFILEFLQNLNSTRASLGGME